MTRRQPQREKGRSFIWVSGLSLAAILLTVAILVAVVVQNGIGAFWPHRLAEATLTDGTRILGEVVQRQGRSKNHGPRLQFKIGNRELYGLDFRWADRDAIRRIDYPVDAVAVERREHGNFYGFLAEPAAGARLAAIRAEWQDALRRLAAQRPLRGEIEDINRRSEAVRLQLLRLRYHGGREESPRVRALVAEDGRLRERFAARVREQGQAMAEIRAPTVRLTDAGGREKTVALADIVRLYQPNTMSLPAKLRFYLGKVGELLTGEPRESNTEGGLFPAIVGTVMMVFIMSIFSFPLGVVTAVYLREYARDGLLVRLVRIAVSNLAGIPSIVYGIFGLGFFIYGVGGVLDRLFWPERLPTPTVGTGGILWASLTLALLTVPVVIVATEEALSAIPAGIREGSLALGSTQFQTLTRILLPMASPGILTGFILAMARAAGEVAPLMITGVVKLAPSLPVDGTFPFVHLDRKFMHLGFHIYDIGFQSPNVEAAKPMVFVTALLLVLIVLVLSSVAIRLRNTMKKRYTVPSF